MKKKFILLSILTACLGISAATYAASDTQSKEYVETDAAGEYNEKTSVQNGLFIKVTDVSTIQDGEELLLVGGSEKVRLQHIVGASYHYWMTTEYGGDVRHFNNDNFIYCSSTKGEMVTMEKNSDGSFYLKLKHFVVNANNYGNVKSGYIVHEAYDNRGVTAFGDLYFRTDKNKPSENAAKWDVTYVDGHIRIVSKTGRLLQWKHCDGYSWSSFIASTHTEWTSNIDLYRKVDPTTIAIGTYKAGDKTTYNMNDEADPTGLEVRVLIEKNETTIADFTSSYASQSYLFSDIQLSTYWQMVQFKWCGFDGGYKVNINHDRSDEHLYLKPDEAIKDLRGTYILGCTVYLPENEQYATFALKKSSLSSETSGHPGVDSIGVGRINPICDTIYNDLHPSEDGKNTLVTNNLFTIAVGHRQGDQNNYGYYIKADNSYALHYDASVGDNDKLKLGSNEYLYNTNEIYTDSNSYVYFAQNHYQLVLDCSDPSTPFIFAIDRYDSNKSNYTPVTLFKLQMTENLAYLDENLSAFKDNFFAETKKSEEVNGFDPTGANRNNDVSSGTWKTLKTSFEALPLDAQSYLASLTYTHNQEKEDSYEELVDIYDSIINTHYDVEYSYPSEYPKVYGFEEFMRRKTAGVFQSKRDVSFETLNCSLTGDNGAKFESTYTATIVPDENYTYPDSIDSIQVMMAGEPIDQSKYSYNSANGEITISKDVVVDSIKIIAKAEVAPAIVTISYVGIDEDGKELIINATTTEGSSYTLLTYQNAGFTQIPTNREFKCWEVNGVEKAPGVSITVSEDTTVKAVFRSVVPGIREIEENTATAAYLSYNYTKNGTDDYTFSNVVVRYRSIIAKTTWDDIEEADDILRFGVLIAPEASLGGVELKNLYDASEERSDIHNFMSSELPVLLNPEEATFVNQTSYSWNVKLKLSINNYEAETKLAKRYVAVGYIVTNNNGVIFLNQGAYSAKDVAFELLKNSVYEEDSFEGSLYYIAHWGE